MADDTTVVAVDLERSAKADKCMEIAREKALAALLKPKTNGRTIEDKNPFGLNYNSLLIVEQNNAVAVTNGIIMYNHLMKCMGDAPLLVPKGTSVITR